MPVDSATQNVPKKRKDEGEGAKGKGKDKQSKEKESGQGKWAENVDYAYEYVPVVQRREGRKNM